MGLHRPSAPLDSCARSESASSRSLARQGVNGREFPMPCLSPEESAMPPRRWPHERRTGGSDRKDLGRSSRVLELATWRRRAETLRGRPMGRGQRGRDHRPGLAFIPRPYDSPSSCPETAAPDRQPRMRQNSAAVASGICQQTNRSIPTVVGGREDTMHSSRERDSPQTSWSLSDLPRRPSGQSTQPSRAGFPDGPAGHFPTSSAPLRPICPPRPPTTGCDGNYASRVAALGCTPSAGTGSRAVESRGPGRGPHLGTF